MWATCQTPFCGNAGEPIDIGDTTITDPDTGETTVTEVFCGVCEHPIPMVTDTREEETT